MADIVASLKEIIDKYPAVLNDDKKLKSILKDYFPDDKKTQNHLHMVADEGILEDMQDATEIKKFKMLGYIHSLATDYGIAEIMAKDAIMTWANALGIMVENVKVEDTSNNISKVKKQGGVVDYSDISIDDIETEKNIIQFRGIGCKVIPNITIKKGTYAVKATIRLTLKYFDTKGHYDLIFNGESEKMWIVSSTLNIKDPGLFEISNIRDISWEIKIIPL